MRSLLAVAIAALAVVPVAIGDGIYHSEHIALSPVAGAPLRTGFVENIHANGPNVFAHEQYVVNGALPSTTYDVVIHVSLPADTTCSAPILTAITATFITTPAGNGSANHVFTPEDVGAVAGLNVHVYWTVVTGGQVAYTTPCQAIQLD